MDPKQIVEDGQDAIADRFGEWRAIELDADSTPSSRCTRSSGSRSFRSRSPKARELPVDSGRADAVWSRSGWEHEFHSIGKEKLWIAIASKES